MKVVMSVLCFIAFCFGVLMFIGSKSAIHEIEGLVCVLIGAIFLSSVCIVDSIEKNSEANLVSEKVPINNSDEK